MVGIAINVGANTSLPGFRAPVLPDGRFQYVPIPEREPTAQSVPTYADLDAALDGSLAESLAWSIPPDYHDLPVHLDPEFATYPFCEHYTYGDEHGVKAAPLSTLEADDYLLFYATLSTVEPAEWLPPTWGAYLIGHFRLAVDPLTAADIEDLSAAELPRFQNNAHLKRAAVDARVLLCGQPNGSALYDRVVPLSSRHGGTDPGWIVRELSADSGRGPWWRRPLRFDERALERLLVAVETAQKTGPQNHQ